MPDHGRLCARKASGGTRDATLVEQGIDYTAPNRFRSMFLIFGIWITLIRPFPILIFYNTPAAIL